MSIAVLVQVYDEVRRLAIAGGAVAASDFRLRKLVAPLEQAGAKAPIFAKVAQAAQAVVDSSEKTASAALLDLATLVNAILYTQGETGAADAFAPLESTALNARETQTSARVLKPLLEALSSTGSGRLEIVREAIERGLFSDLRLVRPALAALDDPYPEIATLIAQRVLPAYGAAIVPDLKATLDIKGRGGQVLRMHLLHRLDPNGSRDVVRRALEEGSKEVRVAAIECLGTTGEDLTCLLDQVKSRAKDVRAAALQALAGAGPEAKEAVTALKKAIDGADLELIVPRLRRGIAPEVEEHLLTMAEAQLASTLAAKDPKLQGPALQRLQQFVLSVRGKTDARSEAFLLKCFAAVPVIAKFKSSPSGQDFNEVLAEVLAFGPPGARRALAAAHRDLTGGMVAYAIIAARETMTPEAFYKEFSPELAALPAKPGKRGAARDRAMALVGALRSPESDFDTWGWSIGEEPEKRPPRRELDPRWLDAAVDAGSVDLVCMLARPGHAKLNRFLTGQAAEAKDYDGYSLMRTMVGIGHPGATDALIEVLKKSTKPSLATSYGFLIGDLVAELPKSALPKLEALLPTLPEYLVDSLMDAMQTLRNKPE